MMRLFNIKCSVVFASDLYQYVDDFSYAGIFIWFAFVEQLTPVPEEVSLISLGYLSMHTVLNPLICGIVSVIGLLCADNLFFFLALKGNKLVQQLTGKINNQLINRIKQNLQRNPRKTLVIMALLPKLRFLSPVISATLGIRWRLFLLINSLATIFYVTLYMLIGILFHHQLQEMLRELHTMRHIIFIIFMIVLSIIIFFMIKKTTKKTS